MINSIFEDVEMKIKKRNKILFTRDSLCIRNLRECIAQQRHATLVLWVFDCMKIPLMELADKYKDEPAIESAYVTCDLWARGHVKMPVAKQKILECHKAAKKMGDLHDSALCHAIGQGCSTVHVETHALGLVFYELTAIVIDHDYKNYELEILKKIDYYMARLQWWQANIDDLGKQRTWAAFLVRPDKINKEKKLLEK